MPIRQKHLLSIYISAIPCPVAPTSIAATGCKRTDVTGRMQPDGKRMANGEPTAVTG